MRGLLRHSLYRKHFQKSKKRYERFETSVAVVFVVIVVVVIFYVPVLVAVALVIVVVCQVLIVEW